MHIELIHSLAFSITHPLIEFVLVVLIIILMFRLTKAVKSYNETEEQLREELQNLSNRRDELDAVLTSMVEGVIAVDKYQLIISLNRAAANLLDIDTTSAVGKPLKDVVHHDRLHQLANDTLWGKGPLQADIALAMNTFESADPDEFSSEETDDSIRMFHAQGSVLRDANNHKIGALIVLHDVTRLRRLELVRRDFVANASHEFKTPVAAIRASAETLQDDPEADLESRNRFLSIVVRQAQRLEAIVEDLLSLARIEEDADNDNLAFESLSLLKLINEAAEACAQRAEAKNTVIDIDCEPSVMANVNRTLLEQSIVNLIDNAIKYSPENSHIRVKGVVGKDEIVISVTDNGPGIAEEHLPRLFERFYRTDKARSRAVGGTGLGLAIVKHVAATHGGRVSVQSTVGKGSTFNIHISNG